MAGDRIGDQESFLDDLAVIGSSIPDLLEKNQADLSFLSGMRSVDCSVSVQFRRRFRAGDPPSPIDRYHSRKASKVWPLILLGAGRSERRGQRLRGLHDIGSTWPEPFALGRPRDSSALAGRKSLPRAKHLRMF